MENGATPMTRNRKVDPEVLEREYIYDSSTPPISLTGLAEKHGLARSGVAEKAMKGNWYQRREAFRETLGQKVADALGEEWVRFETASREKAMSVAMTYLDKYAKALAEDEIKVSTRDFLGVMAMLRTFLGDAAQAKSNGEEVLLDPDTAPINEDTAREWLNRLDAAARSQLGPGEAPPATSPEGAGTD